MYFGTVRNKQTNRLQPVAVKVIKQNANSDDSNETEDEESRKESIKQQNEALNVELNILSYIQQQNDSQHPNLIQLIGTTEIYKHQRCIMTEYCEYGSLETFLQKKFKNNQFISEIVSNEEENVVWRVCGYVRDFVMKI